MKGPRLITSSPVVRSGNNRAHDLNEAGCPEYDGTPDSIHSIIRWLNVTGSNRYQPGQGKTYCNIYAYDYATKLGAYLPRVWWMNKDLIDQAKGPNPPAVKYGETVRELNANELYTWFMQYSDKFGWKPATNFTHAQAAANLGKCVIMVAANLNPAVSGHIVAIVPETMELKAMVVNGLHEATVVCPVMSQAGAVNAKYFCRKWWGGHKTPNVYIYE